MGEDRRSAGEASSKFYGGLLLACALLSVFGLMHHPTVPAQDTSSLIAGLARQQQGITSLHGGLILLVLLQVVGFSGFSRELGLERPSVLAGLVLFTFAMMTMVNAAALNGFAAPAFAANIAGTALAGSESAAAVLKMNWALNQAYDKIGSLAWCGAILCWSLALVQHRGLARMAGLFGLAVAIAVGGTVAGEAVRFNVTGMLAAFAALSAWTVAIALLMLTGRLKSRG